MKLLLDSHTLIWAVDHPERLGRDASLQLADPANDRLLSAAVLWEISIKVGAGKLRLSLPYRQWMENGLYQLQTQILPIELRHTERVATLPSSHGDPFDRMMAAQALADDLVVVSIDAAFDPYGIRRIW